MELVINEGHLVASPHPSWSPFGRERASPLPGMGMRGRRLRPHFRPAHSWLSWAAEHGLSPTKLQKLRSSGGCLNRPQTWG